MSSPIVGVVGAGQLARMMQQAAIGLGVPLRLLAEAADGSAAQVIVDTTVGDCTDWDTLSSWAKGAHVVTFDHEHVPTEHLERLIADGIACRPGPTALVHAQDKAVMRQRLAELNVGQPRFQLVTSAADVSQAAAELGGFPLVLKTARGGYDGKGVWTVTDEAQAKSVLSRAPEGVQMLAEERVGFTRELSALVARSPSGQVAAYPVVESVQRDGVCVEVTAPAPDLDPQLAVTAQQTAMRIAVELGVEGMLAVELFQTRDRVSTGSTAGPCRDVIWGPTRRQNRAFGDVSAKEGRVLVNELAMRPHNTGHWSIDGAVTSQFENHLRAVLDLPLGSPAARSRWTVMVNILGGVGELYDGYPHVQARDPAVRVHLYAKSVRPGRKVGHVTAYGDDLEQVRDRARHAAGWFAGTVR